MPAHGITSLAREFIRYWQSSPNIFSPIEMLENESSTPLSFLLSFDKSLGHALHSDNFRSINYRLSRQLPKNIHFSPHYNIRKTLRDRGARLRRSQDVNHRYLHSEGIVTSTRVWRPARRRDIQQQYCKSEESRSTARIEAKLTADAKSEKVEAASAPPTARTWRVKHQIEQLRVIYMTRQEWYTKLTSRASRRSAI